MFFHYLLPKEASTPVGLGGSLATVTEERVTIREIPYYLLNTVQFSKIYRPTKLMRKTIYPSVFLLVFVLGVGVFITDWHFVAEMTRLSLHVILCFQYGTVRDCISNPGI